MKKQFYTMMTLVILLSSCIWCNAADYGKYYKELPFDIPVVATPVIPELKVFLIDYGGVGDGLTLNTQAFANAIAYLSNNGGGHLVVPEGVWLTGPIVLKSNVDLHVVKSAVVLFTADKTQYPILPYEYEGKSKIPHCQSPISAYREKNFSITGEGVFDGNGELWRPVKRDKVSNVEWKNFLSTGGVVRKEGKMWYPWNVRSDRDGKSNAESAEKLDKIRPCLVRIISCENVLLKGVVFQNSPRWHVHLIMSNNLIVDGILVRCPWNAQNGDGIDLNSCTNTLIVRCVVDAGDDSICLKSGAGEMGRQRGACRNIVIDDCTVFHGHGGFVIGSAMSGGIDKVMVRNCRFLDTDTGLRFKSLRGRGGNVSNVYIDNIVMSDIANYAIWFDLFYQKGAPQLDKAPEGGEITDVPFKDVDEDTPRYQDIHISNIVCRDVNKAMFLNGLPEMNVQNVTIDNCVINAVYGAQIDETSDLKMNNVKLDIAEGPVLMLNNSKNIFIDKLICSDKSGAVKVSGSRNKNIRIENSNLKQENVIATPMASETVNID